MRKDVKLGFAIGGVLLSVLIVYVLVISGGDRHEEISLVKPGPDAVATPAVPKPEAIKPEVAKTEAGKPQAQPEPVTDPFKPSTTAPSVAAAVPEAKPEAKPESTEPAKPAPDAKWAGGVLYTGLPVMLSTTPQAEDPKVSAVPIPAEANRPTDSTSAQPPIVPAVGMVTPASTGAANASAMVRNSAPATRPSQPRIGGEREHTVQAGETFASIAAAAYGNAAYYPHVIRANPTVDPRRLRPGTVIKLPPVSDVRADRQFTPAGPAPLAASTLDDKTQYQVQSGDNLHKISMKLYGKADRFDRIYDLNKSTIGPDAAKLKPGMVLRLPEAQTQKPQ